MERAITCHVCVFAACTLLLGMVEAIQRVQCARRDMLLELKCEVNQLMTINEGRMIKAKSQDVQGRYCFDDDSTFLPAHKKCIVDDNTENLKRRCHRETSSCILADQWVNFSDDWQGVFTRNCRDLGRNIIFILEVDYSCETIPILVGPIQTIECAQRFLVIDLKCPKYKYLHVQKAQRVKIAREHRPLGYCSDPKSTFLPDDKQCLIEDITDMAQQKCKDERHACSLCGTWRDFIDDPEAHRGKCRDIMQAYYAVQVQYDCLDFIPDYAKSGTMTTIVTANVLPTDVKIMCAEEKIHMEIRCSYQQYVFIDSAYMIRVRVDHVSRNYCEAPHPISIDSDKHCVLDQNDWMVRPNCIDRSSNICLISRQFMDLIDTHGSNYDQFVDVLTRDPYIFIFQVAYRCLDTRKIEKIQCYQPMMDMTLACYDNPYLHIRQSQLIQLDQGKAPQYYCLRGDYGSGFLTTSEAYCLIEDNTDHIRRKCPVTESHCVLKGRMETMAKNWQENYRKCDRVQWRGDRMIPVLQVRYVCLDGPPAVTEVQSPAAPHWWAGDYFSCELHLQPHGKQNLKEVTWVISVIHLKAAPNHPTYKTCFYQLNLLHMEDNSYKGTNECVREEDSVAEWHLTSDNPTAPTFLQFYRRPNENFRGYLQLRYEARDSRDQVMVGKVVSDCGMKRIQVYIPITEQLPVPGF